MLVKLIAFVVVLWVAMLVFSSVEGLNKPYFKWRSSLEPNTRRWFMLGFYALFFMPTFVALYLSFWHGLGYLAVKMNANPDGFGVFGLGIAIGAIFTLAISISIYSIFKSESDEENPSDKKK